MGPVGDGARHVHCEADRRRSLDIDTQRARLLWS
jgi:hypothetical protein